MIRHFLNELLMSTSSKPRRIEEKSLVRQKLKIQLNVLIEFVTFAKAANLGVRKISLFDRDIFMKFLTIWFRPSIPITLSS